MTNEEALKFLDEHCTASVIPFEVKVLCSNALEKQIPEKPTDYEDGFLYCESCGHPTLNRDKQEAYCWICGQAIDWSDTK